MARNKVYFLISLLNTMVGCSGEQTEVSNEIEIPVWQAESGLPNSPLDSDLLSIQGQIIGEGVLEKHGMPHMLDGLLIVPTPQDFQFYDVSDPTNPTEQFRIPHVMPIEHFSLAFSNAWSERSLISSGISGAAIFDVSNLSEATVLVDITVEGGGFGEYINRAENIGVQAPWLFVPTSENGIVVVDATDPTDPREVAHISPEDVGFENTGYAWAVGNRLFTSCHSCAGAAVIDISNPEDPVVLDSTNAVETFGYGLTLKRDAMWIATKGESGAQGIQKLTITSEGSIEISDKFEVGMGGSADGGYIAFQDDIFHFGASKEGYRKVDAASLSALDGFELTDIPDAEDLDFAMGFGPLLAIGDDDASTTTLMFHSTQEDTTGPIVEMVNPIEGASGLPSTSRVGIVLSDWIDARSLHPATFQLRDAEGNLIEGFLSTQSGIVNFTPHNYLQSSEYTLLIKGLRDHAGNEMIPFESHFSVE